MKQLKALRSKAASCTTGSERNTNTKSHDISHNLAQSIRGATGTLGPIRRTLTPNTGVFEPLTGTCDPAGEAPEPPLQSGGCLVWWEYSDP